MLPCGLQFQTISPLLERDYPLLDQTHVYQSVFNNGATDWRYFIVIISQTKALFVLCTLFQARVHRKYDAVSRGEKACEIALWLTRTQ
jgi:hypothetical protein